MATGEKYLLILSDDESVRRLFCDAFDPGAVTCEFATGADDAIARLQERQYLILMLDLTSAAVRAHEVIDFLQENPPTKRPLIFALAEDATGVPSKLDPKIVTMVIAKPFDTADIRTIVHQTLASLVTVASEDTLRKLERATPSPEQRTEREPEKAAPAAVLIVDDDRSVQNLIVASLQRERLTTDTANDGAQAIDKLKKRTYCAIILDLMMPRISGWDVIDWLRDNPDKTPYSVIVSTAADRAVLHELDPRVVNAIFVKPFNTLELAGYVRASSALSARDRRSKRVIGGEREIRR